MAYEYNMDPMGSYTGYDNASDTGETEQERQKRLREEAAKKATPVTQTIKTNPVTGEQQVSITGTARDLSAANPRTPTVNVAGPVNPADDVLQRQIQAESGGQHIDPRTGQIMTSPKGALGIGQIMPATAANPGYGIKPATPEEIASKEGNLNFTNRYKEGMLKLFGGDQHKATAAYNAGPGAIQKAEQQAQANGGSWTDYIPKETMGYLGKVFGNMIPNAQAASVPAMTEQDRLRAAQGMAGSGSQYNPAKPIAPDQNPSTEIDSTGNVVSKPTTDVVPQAQAGAAPVTQGPVNPYAMPTTGGAPGLRMPDAMQQQQQQQQVQRQDQMNQFQTATASPDAMIEYMNRKDVPDDLKTAMKINHFEALTAEKRQKDVEEKVKNVISNKPQDIPRLLNDKTEEGSIAKAFLYSLIGFKSGADAEVAKMNLPGKWAAAEDAEGKTGMVLYSTSGKPLQGVNSDNTKMSPEQLSAFASGGLAKGVHVTKVNTKIDPSTGTEYTEQVMSNGKIHVFKDGARIANDQLPKGLTEAGEYNKTNDRKVLAVDARLGKEYPGGVTDKQREAALRKAGVPLRKIEEEMGYAAGTLTAPRPTPTATTAAPSAATAAPAPSAVAPGAPAPAPVRETAAPVAGMVLPSGRAFDPDNPPPAAVGQDKASHDADVKAWGVRKKTYDEQVSSIGDVRTKAKQTLADIDKVLAHPGLSGVVGLTGVLPNIPGSNASNAQAELDKVKGGSFLTAIQGMKGFGSLSNVEGDKAQSAIAALSQKQDEEQFKKNLIEYANTIKRSVNTFESKIGEPPSYNVQEPGQAAGAGVTSSGNKFKRVQ